MLRGPWAMTKIPGGWCSEVVFCQTFCRVWFGHLPDAGSPWWAYRAYVCVQPWLHGSWGQFLPGAQKDPECVYLLGLGLRSRRVGRGGNAVPLQPRPFGPGHWRLAALGLAGRWTWRTDVSMVTIICQEAMDAWNGSLKLRDDYFEISSFKVRELWALESCWCQSNGEIWRNNMFQPLLHRFDHGCSQWFRNLQQSSWVALLRMLLAAPTQQLFVRPCHFVSNLFHILCQDQSKCLASFWDYRRYTHPLVW